jgi:hypothetical protein
MAKKPKRWIQKADLETGALTAKARAKDMTINQFCAQPDLNAKSQRQCRLAATFKRLANKNK